VPLLAVAAFPESLHSRCVARWGQSHERRETPVVFRDHRRRLRAASRFAEADAVGRPRVNRDSAASTSDTAGSYVAYWSCRRTRRDTRRGYANSTHTSAPTSPASSPTSVASRAAASGGARDGVRICDCDHCRQRVSAVRTALSLIGGTPCATRTLLDEHLRGPY
jgi:hypothetical protein